MALFGRIRPTGPATREVHRIAVGGMLSMAAAFGIGRFAYTPILPIMSESLSLSAGQAGLIASANFLGYLLGALLASLRAFPGSRRQWLIAALATSAATTLAMGLAWTMPAFLALRFLGGAASAFVIVFASTLVLERLTNTGQAYLTNIHFAGVGLGIVASAIAVSGLAATGAEWRSAWIATGLLAAMAVPAVFRLVGNSPPSAPPARAAGARDTAHRRSNRQALCAFVAAYGLFGFGYVITATFLVAIVRGDVQIQASEPYIWVLFGLAILPSVALWNRIAARLGTGPTFALACLIEAAGVVLSVLWISLTGIVLATLLLGGTFMGLTALGLAGVRENASGDGRRVLALATASFATGQMIGPSAAGVLSDLTGNFVLASFLAAAALLVAAAIVSMTAT